MAKVTVACTCRQCGSTYERTATKRTRKEANDWAEWVANNSDLCPPCWGAQQRDKEAAKPPTLTVAMLPFATDDPISLVWSGGTLAVKEQIKALGYRWEVPPPSGTLGILSDSGFARTTWCKTTTFDGLAAELEAAATVPGVILQDRISVLDQVAYARVQARRDDQEAKIAAIPQPQKPDCYPTGRWNGKIYGSTKHGHRIYVDGAERTIGADDAKAIRDYQQEKAAYRQAVDAIRRD